MAPSVANKHPMTSAVLSHKLAATGRLTTTVLLHDTVLIKHQRRSIPLNMKQTYRDPFHGYVYISFRTRLPAGMFKKHIIYVILSVQIYQYLRCIGRTPLRRLSL